MARFSAPVILLLLAHLASSAPDKEDEIVLKLAADAQAKFCNLAQAAKQDSAEDGRQVLGSTDNPFYQILLSSKNWDDLMTKIQNKAEPGFVLSVGWPIVLSILVGIVFYCFLMWTCCCKTCRPCIRHRKPGMPKKVAFAVVLGLATVCWIACLAVSVRAYEKISAGVVSASCGAANIIHDVLSGSESTSTNAFSSASSEGFIGIIPMVDTFNTLVGQLDSSDSPLLSGLSGLLANTAKIDEGVAFAEETLYLLRDTMSDAKNTQPEDGGNTLYHQCKLCEEIVEPLNEVVSQVRTGVANALKSTRGEVEEQLDPSGSKIKELRNNLYNSIKPLNDVKDQVRDNAGVFVNPDEFQHYAALFYGNGSPLWFAMTYAFFVSAVIILLGAIGLGFWQFREKYEPKTPNQNPYLLRGPRVVCCTWCNSWIYAINVLFVGGILLVASTPMKGTCLMLADINYENAQKILTSIGVIEDGKVDDNMNTVLTAMDRCLSISQEEFHKQNMTSLNLLDMVILNDGGVRQTARQLVVAKAIGPVNTEFDKLEDRLNNAPPSLSGSEDLAKMRNIFSQNSIGATFLPNLAAIRANKAYQAMSNTPAQILLFSALMCGNFTPNIDLNFDLGDVLNGLSVPGIEWVWNTFSNTRIPGGSAGSTQIGQPTGDCNAGSLGMLSCADFDREPWSDINPNPFAGFKAGCEAGNNYMRNVKNVLLAKKIFQCRYPMTVVGGARVRCDPEMANKDPSGRWINTCLDESTMKFDIEITPCDLSEFTTYVKQFDKRLEKAFELADDAVAQTLDDVKINLRGLVSEYVLNPVYGVVDGLQCNFMMEAYKTFLGGLCYDGAGGFIYLSNSYVISAIVNLCFGIATYIFWRIMRDNYDAHSKEVYKEDAQGNMQGNVQGAVEGVVLDKVPDNVQEDAQGNVQGNVQEDAQGNVQGEVQEDAQGNVQGNVQEVRDNDDAHGKEDTQGNVQQDAQGTVQGNVNEEVGTTVGVAVGAGLGTTVGVGVGTTVGAAVGTNVGMAVGAAVGNVQEARDSDDAHGKEDDAQGNVQGAGVGNVQEDAQGTAITVQESAEGTTVITAQEYLEGTVQEDAQGNVQGDEEKDLVVVSI